MNEKELLIKAIRYGIEIHAICKKHKEAPCEIDKEGHPYNCIVCQDNKKCDCFNCMYRFEENGRFSEFSPDYEEIEKRLADEK